MKKILYILSAAIMMVACNKEEAENGIYGQWHSETVSTEADIYLSLTKDNKFELFQQIGEGRHRLYRGTWTLDGNILKGKYNDGEDWAYSYHAEFSKKSLTLTSLDESAQVTVFRREKIPADIKEGSVVIVKSTDL